MCEYYRSESAELIPEMVRMLKFGNPCHQRIAIRILGEIGPAAKSAIEDIIVAAKSESQFTRDEAIVAMKKIDPTRIPVD